MEGNDFTAHLTLGAVCVYAIEHMKQSGLFPWVTQDTKTLNRWLSAVLALVTAIGIQVTYDPWTGGTAQIPALPTLLLGCWEVVKQYTVNQVLYDGVVAKGKS